MYLASDVINHILSMTNDGVTYKQLLLVCKKWYVYFEPHEWWKNKFLNHYWDMIQNIPDIEWDWRIVSRHKKITMRIIRKFPDKPWEWYIISQRSDFDENLVLQFPDKLWDYHSMTRYVSIDIIITLHHKKWNYSIVQHRLSINFIMTNPYYNWNYFELSADERVYIHFVKTRHNMDWNWRRISKHKDLTINTVLDLYNKDWDWKYLIKRFGFKKSLNFINNEEAGIILSEHEELTMEIIKNNNNILWDEKKICTNPNIPVEDLIINEYGWDCYYITKHPKLKHEHIKNNPNRGWNFYYISRYF